MEMELRTEYTKKVSVFYFQFFYEMGNHRKDGKYVLYNDFSRARGKLRRFNHDCQK